MNQWKHFKPDNTLPAHAARKNNIISMVLRLIQHLALPLSLLTTPLPCAIFSVLHLWQCLTSVHYRVNVLQGVYLTKFSIDHLRESHGTILAVSSMTGAYLQQL